MKKDAHPKYNDAATFTCECGNVVIAGSTLESYKVEICSACHPFYTGKQKLVDSAGRVEKFKAKQEAAKAEKKEDKISNTGKKVKEKESYISLDKLQKIKEKEVKKAEKREATKAGSKTKKAAGASKASSKGANEESEAKKKTATKKTAAKKASAKKATKKADKK